MTRKHILTPIREALLKRANIPIEWSFESESESRINCLVFELHFVDSNFNYTDKLLSACKLFDKSSVGDRFKYNITKNAMDWGYIIKVSIMAYLKRGEKLEDLVTVLKMENLI